MLAACPASTFAQARAALFRYCARGSSARVLLRRTRRQSRAWLSPSRLRVHRDAARLERSKRRRIDRTKEASNSAALTAATARLLPPGTFAALGVDLFDVASRWRNTKCRRRTFQVWVIRHVPILTHQNRMLRRRTPGGGVSARVLPKRPGRHDSPAASKTGGEDRRAPRYPPFISSHPGSSRLNIVRIKQSRHY